MRKSTVMGAIFMLLFLLFLAVAAREFPQRMSQDGIVAVRVGARQLISCNDIASCLVDRFMGKVRIPAREFDCSGGVAMGRSECVLLVEEKLLTVSWRYQSPQPSSAPYNHIAPDCEARFDTSTMPCQVLMFQTGGPDIAIANDLDFTLATIEHYRSQYPLTQLSNGGWWSLIFLLAFLLTCATVLFLWRFLDSWNVLARVALASTAGGVGYVVIFIGLIITLSALGLPVD